MAPDFFDRTLVEWTGYILLAAGVILTFLIQFGVYFRLVFLKGAKAGEQQHPVSILLSTRNDEGRIAGLLDQLCRQDYPDYEVVVVDNFSEDNTLTIVGALSKRYPNLKFSALSQEMRFSGKMVVNLALKAARYDWVIFLTPAVGEIPSGFLKKINAEITEEHTATVNYINYQWRKGFYNRWCRVERFYSFLASAAYSLSGMALFYQQSNVLFQKRVYFESEGFKGRMNDDFADMELLLNCRKMKAGVSVDPDTNLREDVPVGRRDFAELVQKRILIRKNFGWLKRMVLGLEDFAVMALFAGLIWLMITEIHYWFIFVPPFVPVFAVHLFIVKSLRNHLNEKKIFLSSLAYLLVRPVISGYHRVVLAIHMQRNKWI